MESEKETSTVEWACFTPGELGELEVGRGGSCEADDWCSSLQERDTGNSGTNHFRKVIQAAHCSCCVCGWEECTDVAVCPLNEAVQHRSCGGAEAVSWDQAFCDCESLFPVAVAGWLMCFDAGQEGVGAGRHWGAMRGFALGAMVCG